MCLSNIFSNIESILFSNCGRLFISVFIGIRDSITFIYVYDLQHILCCLICFDYILFYFIRSSKMHITQHLAHETSYNLWPLICNVFIARTFKVGVTFNVWSIHAIYRVDVMFSLCVFIATRKICHWIYVCF